MKLATMQLASDVRDLIESATSNPEDRDRLWAAVKAKIDDEPFFVEEDHPSLTVAERQR